MADAITLAGRHLTEGLEIFLRPVTVFRRSAERSAGFTVATLAVVAVMVVAVTEIVVAINLVFPRFDGLASTLVWRDTVETGFWALALLVGSSLVLFIVASVLKTGATLQQAIAVNVSLSATFFGGFLIALIAQAIALVFLGSDLATQLNLLWAGQLAALLLGTIVTGYSIIAARYGGLVSWPVAVLIAVVQLVLIGVVLFLIGTLAPPTEFEIMQRLAVGSGPALQGL